MTSQDPGRVRASHADREQVIEVLKAAFVQGRLTQDEFDARVGQTFASRSYGELAVITADIPGDLAAGDLAAGPVAARLVAAEPRRAPTQAVAWGAGVIIAAVLLAGSALIGNDRLTSLLVAVVCGAAFVAVAQTLYSRHEQRLGRAIPQASRVAQREARWLPWC